MATQNVGIYALDPFSTANPTPAQRLAIAAAGSKLGAAGFDTVILASMHISAAGDINFNDTTMASGGAVSPTLDPDLPQILRGMKTSGTVTKILMSFGGGGCFAVQKDGPEQAIGYWDFLNLKNLMAKYPNPADNPFFRNLKAITTAYPINGVDIDIEVYQSAGLCPNGFAASYDEFTDTLLALTGWVHATGGLTTIAPYEAYDFWASFLAKTYVGGTQQVAWVNLQGGPLFPADDDGFVQELQGKNIGVSNLAGFVSSGMQISTGDAAADVQSAYAPFGKANPDAGGGWLWNFSQFTPDQAASFATAVRQGLKGISPSPT